MPAVVVFSSNLGPTLHLAALRGQNDSTLWPQVGTPTPFAFFIFPKLFRDENTIAAMLCHTHFPDWPQGQADFCKTCYWGNNARTTFKNWLSLSINTDMTPKCALLSSLWEVWIRPCTTLPLRSNPLKVEIEAGHSRVMSLFCGFHAKFNRANVFNATGLGMGLKTMINWTGHLYMGKLLVDTFHHSTVQSYRPTQTIP